MTELNYTWYIYSIYYVFSIHNIFSLPNIVFYYAIRGGNINLFENGSKILGAFG